MPMGSFLGRIIPAGAAALEAKAWAGAAVEGKTMALYLSREWWGRACLHFVAALRAGHWSWHLAGIGREIPGIWLSMRRATVGVIG